MTARSAVDALASPDEDAVLADFEQRIERARHEVDRISGLLAEHKAHLTNLEASRKAFERGQRAARRAQKPKGRSAAEKAGTGNVDAARAALRELRRATAVEIGARAAQLRDVARVNDGTISYAMKALVEEGSAKAEGRERGSNVYVFVGGRRKAVSRPSDR